MYKLINDRGKVLFESHYEMSNTYIAIEDNSYYRFAICADCCPLETSLYINDRLVKTVNTATGASSSLAFRTKVNDNIYVRSVKKCLE